MNSTLINSIFLSIFQNLDILTSNSNLNYKSIEQNPLYDLEQNIFSLNFTNNDILSLNFELLIKNSTQNKIYVVSHSIIIKNFNNDPVIIQKMNYTYNELNNVSYDVKIENFHCNIYLKRLDDSDDNIIYKGITQYYTN